MALAGMVVVGLLSGAVVAVSAGGGGPFPDVGANHPFAEEIGNLADAGITGGYADGGFHPGASVTRASMAAFLGRGLGRVGYVPFGASPEITGDNVSLGLPSVSLTPGADIAGTNGFAIVTATVEVQRNSDTCPCSPSMFIQATKNGFANIEFVGDARNVSMSSTDTFGEMTTQAVIPVTAGSIWQFRVRAANDVTTLSGGTNTQFSGSITVVYVPYGATGGNANP
jgi:hypothetical protein